MATPVVPDKNILQKVNQNLTRAGSGSQSKIAASVSKGEVTISGTIRYEAQRRMVLKAAGAVAGVRRVVDQLKVETKKREHY